MKKRKDSACDLITLDLELVEENKTKRAAIILNEIFNSNNVSFSDETNILLVHDEISRSRDSKHFVQFTTTYKKLTCPVNLKYQPTHAKKVLDQFYSEDENETVSKQRKQNRKKQQEQKEGRRSDPKEENAKPNSMQVERRHRKRRLGKTGISTDDL